ncbi:rod shape-determining protein MreC [Piscinibacter sakaiensis]|uniref:Cell shape-determining protein MreC n=1 Tax=Piscinibacter sakaiensis TaxID=1547922 RepID=A0A0K8P1B4_PISS1|nr:rod shape-determining protein MreC [Piscinibacter sakaiensis]GAP36421.1 rod shape-determining protein MreC [Piscinibacter sakaiensis]
MAPSLGVLDRTPPPFFRQGPSALTKLCFFAALAVLLMVADVRFHVTQPVRAALATTLHPLERVMQVPVQAWASGREYAQGLQTALDGEARARRELAALADRAGRVEHLTLENERLRGLLGLRPGLSVRSQPAEILYEAADPQSRKVVIDRGSQQGVVAGSPVIDERGVLGQVTRVYPLSAEVTLLLDKDASISVMNARTQVRGVAFGPPEGRVGLMQLRFMAGNADVQVGDLLTTSGVDGIFPAGLPVAKVASVGRVVDSGFASIWLTTVALPEGARHVLVLEPLQTQLTPRPTEAPADEARAARRSAPAAARK